MKYLNPRLSYFRFRFVKTDVCHNGILLPVSILTYSPSWAWNLHWPTKFYLYRSTHGGVMMSYRFRRWRKSTSAFGINNATHVEMSAYICTPTFDKITQSMDELLLLFTGFKNRTSALLKFYFPFPFGLVLRQYFASAYQILSKSVNARRSYDAISIFLTSHVWFMWVITDRPRSAILWVEAWSPNWDAIRFTVSEILSF